MLRPVKSAEKPQNSLEYVSNDAVDSKRTHRILSKSGIVDEADIPLLRASTISINSSFADLSGKQFFWSVPRNCFDYVFVRCLKRSRFGAKWFILVDVSRLCVYLCVHDSLGNRSKSPTNW